MQPAVGLSWHQEVLAILMLDAYIPEGALAPEAEERLLGELTDLLLRGEGGASVPL